MNIKTFYDPDTFTLTYVVYDADSRDAVVIDPVLDYDPVASTTATHSVERVAAFIESHALEPHFVLETHAHADHLTGAQYLKRRFGTKVVIGERITLVQETFKGVFDLGERFVPDGSQFDRLVGDGERLQAGTLSIAVIATPGHTPACVSYHIGDAVFTGDALFVEDYGTGRCDFPRGDASALYKSVHDKLYALAPSTRVFVGHDYQPGGRALRFETTIEAERQHNVQLRADTTEAEFVAFREGRDRALSAPRLLFPSIQVNIDAGRLPPAASNGVCYLKTPIDLRRRTEVDGTPR